MGDHICKWRKNHYRQYIFEDASMPAFEYLPGCKEGMVADAWGNPPKFCPHCGGKVEAGGETWECESDRPKMPNDVQV